MRKKQLVPMAFLLLGYFAFADNDNLNSIDNLNTDDFKLNFSKGDDTLLGIDVQYDLRLNGGLHSKMGYINRQVDSVENFTLIDIEGKKGTRLKEEDASISLLYNFYSWFDIGLEYEHFSSNKEQSGYYKSNKGDYLPYDHLVDIKGDRINIVAEINNYDSDLLSNSSLQVKVAPKTNLDIKQNTKIFPNNVEGGELSSSSTLDLSYKIRGQLMFNLGKEEKDYRKPSQDNWGNHFQIGVEGGYEFTPYEYQLKVKDGNSYREKTQTYDEKRKEYFAKVCVSKYDILKDFSLVFRYGKREVDKTGMNSVKENIFTFGIEGKCSKL